VRHAANDAPVLLLWPVLLLELVSQGCVPRWAWSDCRDSIAVTITSAPPIIPADSHVRCHATPCRAVCGGIEPEAVAPACCYPRPLRTRAW